MHELTENILSKFYGSRFNIIYYNLTIKINKDEFRQVVEEIIKLRREKFQR